MSRLLVVEDDVAFSKMLTGFLKKQGHEVEVMHTERDGIKAISENTFDLLLLDYRLPDGDGLSILNMARAKNPDQHALIMTSFNDIRTAVKAMRSGAFDYITKPVNPDELVMVLNEALSKKDSAKGEKISRPTAAIEGESQASLALKQYIQLVAPTEMSVILQGESGTGKENAARTIHQLSSRANKPFVAVDCGAISNELAASELFGHVKGAFTGALQSKKGSFEFAHGGTLFLDEVGNLSYDIQIKLLRVLQEKIIQPVGSNETVKVDVRIICATNDDLNASVKLGKFREDLYHRLNEFKIRIPALRQRGLDLDLFVAHFIKLADQELNRTVQRFAPDVMTLFRNYDWPGNLRELKNVVRRAVLLTSGEVAYKETLPEEMMLESEAKHEPAGSGLKAAQESSERDIILKALQDAKYNKSKAAQQLNIDRKTLYNKITKYNIDE